MKDNGERAGRWRDPGRWLSCLGNRLCLLHGVVLAGDGGGVNGVSEHICNSV